MNKLIFGIVPRNVICGERRSPFRVTREFYQQRTETFIEVVKCPEDFFLFQNIFTDITILMIVIVRKERDGVYTTSVIL